MVMLMLMLMLMLMVMVMELQGARPFPDTSFSTLSVLVCSPFLALGWCWGDEEMLMGWCWG